MERKEQRPRRVFFHVRTFSKPSSLVWWGLDFELCLATSSPCCPVRSTWRHADLGAFGKPVAWLLIWPEAMRPCVCMKGMHCQVKCSRTLCTWSSRAHLRCGHKTLTEPGEKNQFICPLHCGSCCTASAQKRIASRHTPASLSSRRCSDACTHAMH